MLSPVSVLALLAFPGCTRATFGNDGTQIRPRVDKLIGRRYGVAVLEAVIDLTRNLVALRLRLPAPDQPKELVFNVNAPLPGIRIGRQGIARLLRRISPELATEADMVEALGPGSAGSIVEGIWRIVHDGGEQNRRKLSTGQFPAMRIDPHEAPAQWPAAGMQLALVAGEWDRVDLTGAMLAGADLRDMHWRYPILQHANLREANLQGVAFEHANLDYADLRYASMWHATLDRARLRHVNMEHADAAGASFRHSNFSGANLDGLNLTNANLDGAGGIACGIATDFTNASLAGAGVTVKPTIAQPDVWCFMMSSAGQRVVGHQAGCVTRYKQFKALLSIGDAYRTNFIQAAGDLIDLATKDKEIFNAHSIYIEHLLPMRACWSDPRVRLFIADMLLPPLLARWNVSAPAEREPDPALVRDFLAMPEVPVAWRRYSGAVSTLIFADACTGAPRSDSCPVDDDDGTHGTAGDLQGALQRRFLAAPDIAPVVAALDAIEEGLSRLCRIFMALDGHTALVYENTVFGQLSVGLGSPADGYLFERNDDGVFFNQNLHDPSVALCASTLPLLKRLRTAPPACSAAIAHILDGSPHCQRFLGALRLRTLPSGVADTHRQRIPLGDDVALMAHFAPVYDGDRRRTDFLLGMPHVKALAQIVGAQHAWVKPEREHQARMLACIGLIFVRYSAQPLFGTDHDSLISLRDYARACFNRAHMLDRALLPARMADIRQTLLGTPNYAECTDQLADNLWMTLNMLAHGDHRLAQYMDALYPPAWK